MKSKNHEYTAKLVAAILCAAWMLTACGNTEAGSVDETMEPVTETTTEITTEPTKEVVTEPTETEVPVAESTEEPVKTSEEISATEPVAVTAESGVKPSAEPVTASAGTTAETGYTCTEMNQTMYAKSAVNVRDLPGTDGQKIGGLQAGQEISVTGKCDQTGWYQFDLNGTTAYVSDKYIVAEKPVVNTGSTNTANAGNSNTAANQYASNSKVDEFGISDEVIENFMKTHGDGSTGGGTSNPNEYIDRAMSEQVFAMVNAERSAAGIPELTWSEDLYDIAVQRCYEDDGHDSVRPGTGENYLSGAFGDDDANASTIHQKWKNSPGHYNNYMNTMYGAGAVAIRRIPCSLGGISLGDGVVAYEVFTLANNGETTVQEPPIATKTPNDGTSTGTANVGWSLTPPMQEDGLKNWQEQNPDAEVSFGN